MQVYYTLEKHLESFRCISPEFDELYAHWLIDKKTIGKALEAVSHYYPHFSDHDESHSRTIIKNMEMYLGEERIRELGPTDTWLLLMVSYIHDIGMVIVNKLLKDEWSSSSFQQFLQDIVKLNETKQNMDYIKAAKYILSIEDNLIDTDWPLNVRYSVILLTSEFFRNSHPKYSKDALNNLSDYGISISSFNFIPSRIKELIGEISFLHGQSFKEVLNLEFKSNGIGNDFIHPRFIAEMLRLGDLLDLDDGRFTNVFQKMIPTMPTLSAIHKVKHSSITHLLITPKLIEVNANCYTEEVYRATQVWIDWLIGEVNNFAINWSDIVPSSISGGPPKIGQCKLFLAGKENMKKQANLRFEITPEKAFSIIEGSGIYDTKLVFIRELIQNAIDATKMQMWLDIKNGNYEYIFSDSLLKEEKKIVLPTDIPKEVWSNYPIKVKLRIEQSSDKSKKQIIFTIEDRGTGFSYSDINKLAIVGESRNKDTYWSSILEDMPNWLKPTGAFGLGLQSAFLITDNILINSKADGEVGKRISLVSRKHDGYITVEDEVSKKKRGSIISFNLNEETCTNLAKQEIIRNSLYDEFSFNEDSNEAFLNICKEYIEQELGQKLTTNIFNINIMINEENFIIDRFNISDFSEGVEDQYKFRVNLNLSQEITSIKVDIVENDIGSIFTIFQESDWEKSITRHNELPIGVDLRFKGIKLLNSYSSSFTTHFVKGIWDLMGMPAEKYINISRENIHFDQTEYLTEKFIKNIERALTHFYNDYIKKPDILINFAQNVSGNSSLRVTEKELLYDPIRRFLLACDYYLKKEIPTELLEEYLVSPNRDSSLIINQEFENKGNLANATKILIVKRYDKFDELEEIYDISLYQQLINIDEKVEKLHKEVDCIILEEDPLLSNYIKGKYFAKEVYAFNNLEEIDWGSLEFGDGEIYEEDTKYFEIVLAVLEKDGVIGTEFSQDKRRETEISRLFEESKKRSLIYPLIPYGENLMVNILPNNTRTASRFFAQTFTDHMALEGRYIISPFYLNTEVLPEGLTELEFWEWTKSLKGFNSLIKFILNNTDGRVTEVQIIESYRLLVGDFYKLM
ncbi:hypothetical protein M3612_25225 [Niallia taxi]|uniref:HD domain-containing protein n=1 Tax=Niallia taxi TaxID=2499688 RepID=UPI00203C9EC0|nr:hypothetical protein [Niallia taxi]MCM3217776.1 hypothetical protein [Niallia taxi]